MKNLIFTFVLMILPLVGYAQKSEKIFQEALIHYNNENYSQAIPLLEKCIEKKYDRNGDVYSLLCTGYEAIGDTNKWKTCFLTGLERYPNNISLLASATSYYLNINDLNNALLYTNRFLVHEPNNASIYYVKGNILKDQGKIDEAIKAYQDCSKVDPQYVFGDLAIGIHYYEKLFAIQEELGELSATNSEKWENYAYKAHDLFDKAFKQSSDVSLKVGLAEYLSAICNILQSVGDSEMKEKYSFYSEYYQSGGLN